MFYFNITNIPPIIISPISIRTANFIHTVHTFHTETMLNLQYAPYCFPKSCITSSAVSPHQSFITRTLNSEHIVTLYLIIFMLHIFNNFPNISSSNLQLTHVFITTYNLNLSYYITQFKQYPCFLKLIWNSDKLKHIVSRMICKYLFKHLFSPKTFN